MKYKLFFLFAYFILLIPQCRADEGMWLPVFLKQLNEDAMIKKGLKIPVDQIYSVNNSSMKDAVVLFGGGCTAEIISDKGLLLTNHHCGYSSIQAQSSVDHDYLTDGYWAMTQDRELPCPNLTVTFIIRIEDVSDSINKNLNVSMSEIERDSKIHDLCSNLEAKAIEGTHYDAKIKPFFNGNQFFLFLTETFKDIRLVGAPPSSIGNFGADTDNWMWPRHTGDFSMFRIYADKENKPAPYSKENIPFKPRWHFTISLKGIDKGDFTMVYGFPGRTQEYLPSYAIDIIEKTADPTKIKIRDARLKIMEDGMKVSDTVRIQYASKQRSLGNAFKKWQGEIKGLKRLDTIRKKKEFEKSFMDWVNNNNKTQYKNLLSEFEKTYSEFSNYNLANDYFTEGAMGIELISYTQNFQKLVELSQKEKPDEAEIKKEAEKLKTNSAGFFKNYDSRIDKNVFAKLLKMFHDDLDKSFYPDIFKMINEKYKNDFRKYADDMFSKTFMISKNKVDELLTNFSAKSAKKILKDPAYILMKSITDNQKQKVAGEFAELNETLNKLNRHYMAAQMEMQSEKKFYPDANLTMRITYGQVMDYVPRDAVHYNFYTTLEGVMEKEDASDVEFIVPKKLKELYEKKDYGQYGKNGSMPLAFIASNHTTGGNSGSPVINANGELIGTNFDRVWEGTMSDYQYDSDECRNIALDIRYTLFVVDKFAGCKRLVDEMTIVN
ncbi:MAG: S46 family peptidase [Bacteroidota bacterium]